MRPSLASDTVPTRTMKFAKRSGDTTTTTTAVSPILQQQQPVWNTSTTAMNSGGGGGGWSCHSDDVLRFLVDQQLSYETCSIVPEQSDPLYYRNEDLLKESSVGFERVCVGGEEYNSFFLCVLYYEGLWDKCKTEDNLICAASLRKELIDRLLFASFGLQQTQAKMLLEKARLRSGGICNTTITEADSLLRKLFYRHCSRTKIDRARAFDDNTIGINRNIRLLADENTGLPSKTNRWGLFAVKSLTACKPTPLHHDFRNSSSSSNSNGNNSLLFANFFASKVYYMLNHQQQQHCKELVYGEMPHIVAFLKYLLDSYLPTYRIDEDLLLSLYAECKGTCVVVVGFDGRDCASTLLKKLKVYKPTKHNRHVGAYLYLLYIRGEFEVLEPVTRTNNPAGLSFFTLEHLQREIRQWRLPEPNDEQKQHNYKQRYGTIGRPPRNRSSNNKNSHRDDSLRTPLYRFKRPRFRPDNYVRGIPVKPAVDTTTLKHESEQNQQQPTVEFLVLDIQESVEPTTSTTILEEKVGEVKKTTVTAVKIENYTPPQWLSYWSSKWYLFWYIVSSSVVALKKRIKSRILVNSVLQQSLTAKDKVTSRPTKHYQSHQPQPQPQQVDDVSFFSELKDAIVSGLSKSDDTNDIIDNRGGDGGGDADRNTIPKYVALEGVTINVHIVRSSLMAKHVNETRTLGFLSRATLDNVKWSPMSQGSIVKSLLLLFKTEHSLTLYEPDRKLMLNLPSSVYNDSMVRLIKDENLVTLSKDTIKTWFPQQPRPLRNKRFPQGQDRHSNTLAVSSYISTLITETIELTSSPPESRTINKSTPTQHHFDAKTLLHATDFASRLSDSLRKDVSPPCNYPYNVSFSACYLHDYQCLGPRRLTKRIVSGGGVTDNIEVSIATNATAPTESFSGIEIHVINQTDGRHLSHWNMAYRVANRSLKCFLLTDAIPLFDFKLCAEGGTYFVDSSILCSDMGFSKKSLVNSKDIFFTKEGVLERFWDSDSSSNGEEEEEDCESIESEDEEDESSTRRHSPTQENSSIREPSLRSPLEVAVFDNTEVYAINLGDWEILHDHPFSESHPGAAGESLDTNSTWWPGSKENLWKIMSWEAHDDLGKGLKLNLSIKVPHDCIAMAFHCKEKFYNIDWSGLSKSSCAATVFAEAISKHQQALDNPSSTVTATATTFSSLLGCIVADHHDVYNWKPHITSKSIQNGGILADAAQSAQSLFSQLPSWSPSTSEFETERSSSSSSLLASREINSKSRGNYKLVGYKPAGSILPLSVTITPDNVSKCGSNDSPQFDLNDDYIMHFDKESTLYIVFTVLRSENSSNNDNLAIGSVNSNDCVDRDTRRRMNRFVQDSYAEKLTDTMVMNKK